MSSMIELVESNWFDMNKPHIVTLSPFSLGRLTPFGVEEVMRDGRAASCNLTPNFGEMWPNLKLLLGEGKDAVVQAKPGSKWQNAELRNLSRKRNVCSLGPARETGTRRKPDRDQRIQWLREQAGVIVSLPLLTYRRQLLVLLPTRVIVDKMGAPEKFKAKDMCALFNMKGRSLDNMLKNFCATIDWKVLEDNKAYSFDHDFKW